jgi:carboxyl-terminal processing protease
MSRKIILIIISLFVAVVLFAGGFLIGFNIINLQNWLFSFGDSLVGQSSTTEEISSSSTSPDTGIRSIEQTINSVLANALNKKTRDELVSAAIEGILESLDDRYADYFSKEEYTRIIDSLGGTMSGIGVVITLDDEDRVVVVNPIEGTPAAEKGLMEGDVIVAVDDVDITGMALDEVVAMIKGPEGTDVKITVFRPSENSNIDYVITRQRFYIPNYNINELEDGILHIQYIDFQEDGAEKLKEELDKTIDGSTKGVILDLRNNLGGTLNDAVELSDLFLDDGAIVTVRGRSNNQDSFEEFKASPGGFTEIPLVVLINGFSASASELAAGALRDLERATIIGENSFGKGTVQVLNDLADGSGIKYTTAKYFLPSGISIDGVGISPDIIVVLTPEDTEDLQLERAIEELKKMIEND